MPRKLPGLFLAATLVPVVALVWLGWRLLEQDRALENQRIVERLEDAADLIAAAMDRRISGIQDRLAEPDSFFTSSDPPADGLIVRFGAADLDAYPPGRLLFRPQIDSVEQAPDEVFAKGEFSEFRNKDYAAAAAFFSGIARSNDPVIRAGALVRLARNLRKAGRNDEALSVYEELAKMESVSIGHDPAGLVGHHARLALLLQLGRREDVLNPALRLYNDLQNGRWPMTRSSYEYYTADVRKWLGNQIGGSSNIEERLALSDAIGNFWKNRSEFLSEHLPPRGRRSIRVDDRSFLLIWNRSNGVVAAFVAGPGYLASEWKDIWEGRRIGLGLIDNAGNSVLDQTPLIRRPQVLRTSNDTGLPWTLRVSSAADNDAAQSTARRRILISVLAVMALTVLACGYFTARAAARELAVARLQSDFVSAVSHEFRTPLTSMRHLTELLEQGVVSSEERKQKCYGVLAHETRRLHRLVESLLNFGRMEAGKFQYQFEALDAAAIVREVAGEFQGDGNRRPCNIGIDTKEEDPVMIRCDREALGLALWNLLDNAVKYSPAECTVRVELAREDSCAAIRVKDQGPGIPPAEQKEIFKKFVRGSASRESSAKGAGIGLAMVTHIVDAHKGRVRVESRVGEGSTFSILLPEKG